MRKNILATVFLFYNFIIFSQSASFFDANYDFLNGIWENDRSVVEFYFNENNSIQSEVVLKTFYGFYYDGIFYPQKTEAGLNFARLHDGLYTQYWISRPAYRFLADDVDNTNETILAEGVLWLPATNKTEFSINDEPIQAELLAYYVDEQNIYAIRYWLAELDFSDEKAELTLVANRRNNEGSQTVLVDKYIQIGDAVYTCATGLRKIIRNVTTIDALPDNAIINDEATLLVFGDPYFNLSDITNLEEAIEAHNSIVYPPRDGRARFEEPSIYKKLENMTIDDFPVTGAY